MAADKFFPARQRHIAVHQGALGDFLLIWPALLSLARELPEADRYWAGREAHCFWANAAGWRPAPAGLQKGVERLYTTARWPPGLEDSFVTWLGLRKPPLLYPQELEASETGGLWFLACIQEERFASPRQIAREKLQARGIPWAEDWRDVFRGRFGGWCSQSGHAYDVLLFPGAGHRAKQWGLVQFLELASRLQARGRRTAFVLGPAEVERGLDPVQAAKGAPFLPEVLSPASLQELGALLLQTRLVLGNDCGPLHLASMHGVPGVVLFGPTSRRQWAPEGLKTLASPVTCRPCTLTTSDITCTDVRCLQSLSVEQVAEALEETAATKWGL